MIVTIGTAVLAALLGPMLQAPAPSGSALPGATPSANFPPGDLIRRGPESAPRMLGPHGTSEDVTIVNSGSTNAAGYTIVVHPDYSSDVVVGGVGLGERKTVGPAQARWLFAKVREASPLDEIPGGACVKSMSFGFRLTITYAHRTTGDLACAEDGIGHELFRTAGVIAAQLEIPMRRAPGVPAH